VELASYVLPRVREKSGRKMVPQSGNLLYDPYDEDVNGPFFVFVGRGDVSAGSGAASAKARLSRGTQPPGNHTSAAAAEDKAAEEAAAVFVKRREREREANSRFDDAEETKNGGLFVEVLRSMPAAAEVQRQGCYSIVGVTYESDDARRDFAAAGGIEVFLPAMATPGESPDVCGPACRALSLLAFHDENEVAFVAQGGFGAVLKCMGRHGDSP
jgi:hypothetical protein